MREIGRRAADASLGMALSRGTLLQRDIVVALERWVRDNTAS